MCKKVKFGEKPPGTEAGEAMDEKIAKKLNFPEAADHIDNFHMVRGYRICALLVDPGAASGLIGTDTLKELMEAGMIPQNDKVN